MDQVCKYYEDPETRTKVDTLLKELHILESRFDWTQHCPENNVIREKVRKIEQKIKRIDKVFYSQITV